MNRLKKQKFLQRVISLNDTLEYINKMNHGVIPILGSGKTFKSGTMYSLFDILPGLRSRKKAFYRFPTVMELFPSLPRCYPVSDIWDVEPDSIAVIEDANRVFPSRSSSRSAELQEWLGIISHKDILVFLTVQNTSNTDLAFFRDQDVVFLHKKMNLTALQYERSEFRQYCGIANVVIDDVARFHDVNPLFVSYAPRFGQAVLLRDPPAWYGHKQSHALRDYDIRAVV